MAKIFVSYCHAQKEWVLTRLVPCLEAGGVDVLIDRECFEAAKSLVFQMDSWQDQADKNILILSKEYLDSPNCKHEMERAILTDSNFTNGKIILVKVDDSPLPACIKNPNPLYVSMKKPEDAKQWTLLMQACGSDLGTSALEWLNARDEIVRHLLRGESVNLVYQSQVKLEALLEHIKKVYFPQMGMINLENPQCNNRRGLLSEILSVIGNKTGIPNNKNDLDEFGRIMKEHSLCLLTIKHFDLAKKFDLNLFSSLRYLTMDKEGKRLVLLVLSHSPFTTLLPKDNPLSAIDIKTVKLEGHQ